MGLLDRVIQRKILEKLAANYPGTVSGYGMNFVDADVLRPNIAYLVEHNLVERPDDRINNIRAAQNADARNLSLHYKLTSKCLDFLEDDGGLSAVLNVVTVKLQTDTIRDLLSKKVNEANLLPEDKSRLGKAIKDLSAEALTAGAGDLMKMGLDHAPSALGYIRTLVGF